MNFQSYFLSLTAEQRKTLAAECETTVNHLRNIAYNQRQPSVELAVLIEQKSDKAVTRQELFPLDFKRKWPELD